jgi:hypothetical protein
MGAAAERRRQRVMVGDGYLAEVGWRFAGVLQEVRAAAKLGDHGDDLPLSYGTGVPPGFLVDLRAWRVPVLRM